MKASVQRPFCIAPWTALCLKSNGDWVPDTQFQGRLGNLSQNTLKETLQGEAMVDLRKGLTDSIQHSGCVNCHKKEASGGHSRRIFFDHTLQWEQGSLDFHERLIPELLYLEINTSNVCNLKCRMCNGMVSTSWKEDEKFLSQQHPELDRPQFPTRRLSKQDIDRLFLNPETFEKLQFLALRGGEPLLEESNLYILDKFIDLGLASKITLDISTNGSIFSEKIIKSLSAFKKLKLYVSLEAIGSLYGYIRGGSDFDLSQIEKNIRYFQNLANGQIIFTYTSMVYNLGHINRFWKWFLSIRRPGDSVSFSNIVVNPPYLNFQILPDDLKDYYFNQIENGPIPKGPFDTGKEIVGTIGIESILKGLQNKSYFNSLEKLELRKKFKVFNETLDEARGSSLTKVVPELTDFYNSI